MIPESSFKNSGLEILSLKMKLPKLRLFSSTPPSKDSSWVDFRPGIMLHAAENLIEIVIRRVDVENECDVYSYVLVLWTI